MGAAVGAVVGLEVGLFVGLLVGDAVGLDVGCHVIPTVVGLRVLDTAVHVNMPTHVLGARRFLCVPVLPTTYNHVCFR